MVQSKNQLDAISSRERRPGVFSTDPPYYDNVSYADLSDFFYVWLRRSLRPIYPDLFSTLLVPKKTELVVTAHRFEGSKETARDAFESRLATAFGSMKRDQDQFLGSLRHWLPPNTGRMPEARILNKLPIEIVVRADERHHRSVRNPQTHAYRRASTTGTSVGAGCSCHPTGTKHHLSPRVPLHPVWQTPVARFSVLIRGGSGSNCCRSAMIRRITDLIPIMPFLDRETKAQGSRIISGLELQVQLETRAVSTVQREPGAFVALACLEPWQQCQRVIAANSLEIACRKAELHHAFSRLGEGDEGIVAAEQNLCSRDETRECRNRRSITVPAIS